MNQIEYTISLQRILAITSGLSFFSLCLMLVFTSPFESINYIWLLFFTVWILLTTIFSLIGYWWVFTIKKDIISILQSNLVISKSGFLALSLVYLLNTYISKSLDAWTTFGLIVLNIIFFYFIDSYN